MTIDQATTTDGRRARRDRNRAAVIDAVFGLLDDGVVTPSSDAIADRAGVSVSSVFRYFDTLEDLQEQTITAHFERFGHLFDVPQIGTGCLTTRIDRFVTARTTLYGTIAPIGRLARARALDQPRIADTLARTRSRFSTQIREHFAFELEGRLRADEDDVVALIDAMTSFESWDLLHTSHRRGDARIRRAWITGITALLDAS